MAATIAVARKYLSFMACFPLVLRGGGGSQLAPQRLQ
jgi:hypothetical protein